MFLVLLVRDSAPDLYPADDMGHFLTASLVLLMTIGGTYRAEFLAIMSNFEEHMRIVWSGHATTVHHLFRFGLPDWSEDPWLR